MFSFSKCIFSFQLLIITGLPAVSAENEGEGAPDSPNRIENFVRGTVLPELEGASVGLLAVSPQGDTLADMNSGRLFIPASNMKLITTGLALDRLGSGYTFDTRIGFTGKIEGGILNGDIYIVGGGDPTLASDDSIAAGTDELFREWTGIIRKAGIRQIEGHIVGDDRFFDIGMPEDRTWQWDDCGTYYGTGISGLNFYENIQSFHVSAGAHTGDPVTVTAGYPVCPWMKISYDCYTAEAGTGDRLYYYTSDLAPVGKIRGTFAADRAPKTIECSNKFPAYTCASYFRDWLEAEGISCRGGAADCGYFSRPGGQKKNAHCPDIPAHPENIGIIGMTESPVLSRIVFETNHESNNVYAEVLFHTLGKAVTRSAGYDSSRSAAEILLSGLGLDPEEVNIVDGSGLSRQNLLSPSFICGFLEAMTESDEFGSFASSLPSPGSGGTMQAVMQGYDTSLTSRIRLKSGSMNGIKCFSGYVFPVSGEKPAVFSIMINNSLLSQYRMQKIIDRILFLLVSELDRTGQ